MTTVSSGRYTAMPAGELRPIERREQIRQALETGDWYTAAVHLHRAHQDRANLATIGLSCWAAYVETIPLSRMHDWRLRLVAGAFPERPCYTLRVAVQVAQERRLHSA